MTQEQFFQLMRNPQNVADISTKELGQLVEQFPYSQPLRFIYLKQLKEQNSVHYNQQLKLTSIYSPDRSRLFNYVHEDAKVEMEILTDVLSTEEIKSEHENISSVVEPEIQKEEIVIAPPVSLDEEEFFTEEIINETSVQPEIKIEQEEIITSKLTGGAIIISSVRISGSTMEEILSDSDFISAIGRTSERVSISTFASSFT